MSEGGSAIPGRSITCTVATWRRSMRICGASARASAESPGSTIACGAAPLPQVVTRSLYRSRCTARISMPVQMHSACRTAPRYLGHFSGTEAQLQTDPGGLSGESHRHVDGEHRLIALVVPGLDVVHAKTLRITDRHELERHCEALSARLTPHTGQALPDKGGILNGPLQVRHTEPTALGVDGDEERVREEAWRVGPVLLPLFEGDVGGLIHCGHVATAVVGELVRLVRGIRIASELVGERADTDALCGQALGGTGELVEVEPRDGQTRFPVTFDLDPPALLRKLDAIGHRLFHSRGRGERVPLAQDRDGGVM